MTTSNEVTERAARGWIVESTHDTDFTNDPELAAYWTRKGRNVVALYDHPAPSAEPMAWMHTLPSGTSPFEGGSRSQVGFSLEGIKDELRVFGGTITPLCACTPTAAIPRTSAEAVPDPRLQDLRMLVQRLCRSLSMADPGSTRPAEALDYLQRVGLAGSPLRATPAPADSAAERDAARLADVNAALTEYYDALTARLHGGVAQSVALNKIERAMGTNWGDHKAAMQQKGA